MKRFFFSLLWGAGIAMLSAQAPTFQIQDSSTAPTLHMMMDSVFALTDLSGVSSGILADRGFQYVPIEWYDGTLQPQNKLYYETWHGLYASMYTAAIDTNDRLPHPVGAYREDQEALTEGSPIPLGLLYMDYHQLDTNSIADGLLAWSGVQLTDVVGRSRSPYLARKLFGATPLRNSHLSRQVSFVLDSAYWFTNSSLGLDRIEIDFGDGAGFRVVDWQQEISLVYPDSGDYLVTTRLTFEDAGTAESHAHFRVEQAVSTHRYGTDVNDTTIVRIPAEPGVHSGGQFTISLGCGPDALDRPLIVVQGITVGGAENGVDYNTFLRQIDPLAGPNLKDVFEDEGYDLVYVEYADGEDFIERNAYFLQDVIREVNDLKVGDEENVIMGVSMGGIVTRYALRDMELADPNSLGSPIVEDHQCRLYISYDSPHRGANIPLGLQHMVLHLATSGPNGLPIGWAIPGITDVVGFLNSPAARQLLVYHAFNVGSILYPPLSTPFSVTSPEHTAFYDQLELMGMPQQTDENIAISNGSGLPPGQARDQGFQAGDVMFELSASHWTLLPWWGAVAFSLTGSNVWLDFQVNAVPDGNPQQIYRGVFDIRIFGVSLFTGLRIVAASNTLPYDNAPGGSIPVGIFVDPAFIQAKLIAIGVPANIAIGAANSLTINADQFNFIPAVSALNVDEPQSQDLFFDVRSVNLLPNGLTTFARVKPIEALPPSIPLGINANENHNIYPVEIARWLIDDDMALLPDASLNAGFSTQLSAAYNFGAGPVERTTDRLIQSININSAGHLSINRNQEVGNGGNGWNVPIAGSSFEVSTVDENCDGPLTVRVNSGGLLSVGDPNDYATGVLRITEDNALILNDGGTLRIHDHSRVIIERGATLRLNAGNSIELLGDDAVLEIRGTLEVEGSLTFTGAGFIRLGLPASLPGVDGNVRLLGSGLHGIYLAGSGPQDKVLEIMPGTNLQPGNVGELDVFTILNAKVELGAGAYLNPRDADLFWQDATFTNQGAGAFEAIYGNGQSNHWLRRISIDGGRIGLRWRGEHGDQADLRLTDSEIRNCGRGIYSSGVAVRLVNVDFSNNNYHSWLGRQSHGNSEVFDSEMSNGALAGIALDGNSNLHLKTTRLVDNQNFNVASNSYGIHIASHCTEVSESINGFNIRGGVLDLTLTPDQGTYLHDNRISIYLRNASGLLLSGGENHLVPDPNLYSYALYGSLNTSATSLAAHGNKWNTQSPNPSPPLGTPSPGTAPVFGTDYDLVNASAQPITLNANPLGYEACGQSGGNGTNTNRIAPCPGCPALETSHFSATRLDLALNQAINTMQDDTLGYPDPAHTFEMLHEIVAYDGYPEIDAATDYHLDFGHDLLAAGTVCGH